MENLCKIIIILLLPIISYGQDTISIRSRVNEINTMVSQIDSIAKIIGEGIIEGPILDTKLKKNIGGWEAYFVTDKKTNLPTKILYTEIVGDSLRNLKIYYKNSEVILLTLEINFTGKKKKESPLPKGFYLHDGKIIMSNSDENELMSLMNEEKRIKKMIYK